MSNPIPIGEEIQEALQEALNEPENKVISDAEISENRRRDPELAQIADKFNKLSTLKKSDKLER
jgi:hypothetical protein